MESDIDGDSIHDCEDRCISGVDTDADGVEDCAEECILSPVKTDMGLCGCYDTREGDSDGDGVPNCLDVCPEDPDWSTSTGACGCGATDADGDGWYDCMDQCPRDPLKLSEGDCGCGVPESADDVNLDGILDCQQPCLNEPDTDGDGVSGCDDACPNDATKVVPGVCGCGASDIDSDGDGQLDCEDGCPADPAKLLPLECGCGVEETGDTDSDGTPDCRQPCFGALDTDGDGVMDCLDECPADPDKVTAGCGCGVVDEDVDGDGVADCEDICVGGDAVDLDGDGVTDGCAMCSLGTWAPSPNSVCSSCPIPGNCGDASTCIDGASGELCATCDAGYYLAIHGCTRCSWGVVAAPVAGFLVCFVLLALFLRRFVSVMALVAVLQVVGHAQLVAAVASNGVWDSTALQAALWPYRVAGGMISNVFECAGATGYYVELRLGLGMWMSVWLLAFAVPIALEFVSKHWLLSAATKAVKEATAQQSVDVSRDSMASVNSRVEGGDAAPTPVDGTSQSAMVNACQLGGEAMLADSHSFDAQDTGSVWGFRAHNLGYVCTRGSPAVVGVDVGVVFCRSACKRLGVFACLWSVAPVVRMLLASYDCVHTPSGPRRLRLDMSVDCDSSSHGRVQAACAIPLLLIAVALARVAWTHVGTRRGKAGPASVWFPTSVLARESATALVRTWVVAVSVFVPTNRALCTALMAPALVALVGATAVRKRGWWQATKLPVGAVAMDRRFAQLSGTLCLAMVVVGASNTYPTVVVLDSQLTLALLSLATCVVYLGAVGWAESALEVACANLLWRQSSGAKWWREAMLERLSKHRYVRAPEGPCFCSATDVSVPRTTLCVSFTALETLCACRLASHVPSQIDCSTCRHGKHCWSTQHRYTPSMSTL